MTEDVIDTQCCIAGGGPAGVMLGFLLARAGVSVVVLEKHADFLRDFRGDTIHPSTLDLMDELGLLDAFLARPHQKVLELEGQVGPDRVKLADFRRVPGKCKFMALMPQWDFLRFLVDQAKAYPTFRIEMETEVEGLVFEGEKVTGVRCRTKEGPKTVRAALTVGADGRRSVVREKAKLTVRDLGAPMDVLWLRVSRRPDDPPQTFGHIEVGRMLVMLNREEYWQCAYLIAKGEAERVKEKGAAWLREDLVRLEPFLRGREGEIADWDKDVHLLTVRLDRLDTWAMPGLLCIGDAAHAMSPVGGVGINLALQDAVAASNLLAEPLLHGVPTLEKLAAVQHRRDFPTRATQRVQLMVHRRVVEPVLGGKQEVRAPWLMRVAGQTALFRSIPAIIVGIGFRPEHIRTSPRPQAAPRSAVP